MDYQEICTKQLIEKGFLIAKKGHLAFYFLDFTLLIPLGSLPQGKF